MEAVGLVATSPGFILPHVKQLLTLLSKSIMWWFPSTIDWLTERFMTSRRSCQTAAMPSNGCVAMRQNTMPIQTRLDFGELQQAHICRWCADICPPTLPMYVLSSTSTVQQTFIRCSAQTSVPLVFSQQKPLYPNFIRKGKC